MRSIQKWMPVELVMADSLLVVDRLKSYIYTRYGVVRAVNDVSFELAEGDTLGIVGESGSGKSMTCMSILGLLPQPFGKMVAGRIRFRNEDLHTQSSRQMQQIRGKEIGMVFQDPMTSLNPFLTVGTQLTEGYVVHQQVAKQEAWQHAIDMLDKVGIPEAEKRMLSYPHELSGGMRQRVMIAIALMCSPALLIADEPTSALDVTIQAQILELLKSLQRQMKMSIILITHDLGIVAATCKQVIVMYAGRVMEAGSVDDIFYRPKHPYTIGLLQSVPSLEADREKPLQPIDGNPPDLMADIQGCPFHPRCAYGDAACLQEFPQQRTATTGHSFYCCKDVE